MAVLVMYIMFSANDLFLYGSENFTLYSNFRLILSLVIVVVLLVLNDFSDVDEENEEV